MDYVFEKISGNTVSEALKGKGDCSFQTHGFWTGKLAIEQSSDQGQTWNKLRIFSSENDLNFGLRFSVNEETLVRVRAFQWESGTCHAELQFTSI